MSSLAEKLGQLSQQFSSGGLFNSTPAVDVEITILQYDDGSEDAVKAEDLEKIA